LRCINLPGSPQAFGGVGAGPEGDVEEDGTCPCGFETGEFWFVGDGCAEEFADGKYDRNEAEKITEWDERRCLTAVGEVLFCGRVAEADLFLVVEPRAVVRAEGDVDDPLHETLFNAGFVAVVRFAVRADEPVREVWLRSNDGAPGVDHGLGLLLEECRVLEQEVAVYIGPADGLFEVAEVFVGERGLGTLAGAEVVAGDLWCGDWCAHYFASAGSMRWMMAR
jgi:hypothetical protein